MNFINDFCKLLNDYKFRVYDMGGTEIIAIPLSWIFIILIIIVLS